MSEIIALEGIFQKNDLTRVVGGGEDSLEWEVVEQYLPLVRSLVAKMRIYFPEGVEVEDMYSIGLAGLISAVRNKDSQKGKSFGAYAKIRIRGVLLDELRRLDALSREERYHVKRYHRSVDALAQKLNRLPVDEEICSELCISEKEYARIKNIKNPVFVPLDAVCALKQSEGALMHETIFDPTEQDGRDFVQNHELVELLRACIAQLEEVPRRVLGMYYLEDMRLAEIASVFNLTESRICQIHASSLDKLRVMLKERMVE